PANLLRDVSHVVKLTDLGVARLCKADATTAPRSITQTGTVLGSVHYMATEQALDSTTIDFRADIYSLGATLYFLLVGRPPFEATSAMAVLLKHREDPIPSLVASRSDVPAMLDTVYRRMMAKKPADRYQTMTQLVEALEAVQKNLSSKVTAAQVDSAQPGATIALKPSPGVTGAFDGMLLMPADALASPTGLQPPQPIDISALKVVLVEPSRTQSRIIRK